MTARIPAELATGRQTFGKHERLRASERITIVLKTGRRFRHDGLSLMIVPTNGAELRAGFIVRRKLGGAVVRNLMKRRMRESYRRLKSQVAPGSDLVFSANAVVHYAAVSQSMARLLSQSGLSGAPR
jgi:ribonuclease P protein component